MFPQSKKIIKISNKIIIKWHKKELQIFSFDNAFQLMENTNKDDIYYHIELLSLINTMLWHEEDKARDSFATDTDIAGVKRKIDKLNATRVNKVEEIDANLYKNTVFNENATISTETPASVVDRLTILTLKQYHMAYEAKRKDSSKELKNNCAQKLAMINKQMDDLTSAYDIFISDIEAGKRRYALYRQFKMYNDPELNPIIYKNSCKTNANQFE
jgi:hypothetical protein